MFQKILKVLSIFKNLENIKKGVNLFYFSTCKVITTLKFIETQVADINLNSKVKEYLPETIKILEKIKQLIEKYGDFIGFTPPVDAQQLVVSGELKNELADLNKKLNGLL